MTDWDAYARAQPNDTESLQAEPVQWARVQKIRERVVGSVLDVGGGDGVIAKLLADDGHDVLVVDASAERVARARANGVSAVHTNVVYKSGSRWDTVLLGEVLEHQTDPGTLIADAFTYARERVVITLPLDGWPDPTHEWRISLDVLEAPSPHTDQLRPDPQRQIVLTFQRGKCWDDEHEAEYWRYDHLWREQFGGTA